MKKTEKKSKELLSEATIKRFGMLANIPAITKIGKGKIKESLFGEEKEEMPPMGGEEELPPEASEEPAEPSLSPEAVTKLVDAIAMAIQQETGIPVEVEGGAGGEEMEMGEPSSEEPPMPSPEGGEGLPPKEEEGPEEEEEGKPPIQEVEIVEESEDLTEAEDKEDSKEDQMINEISRRIIKKLAEKIKESKSKKAAPKKQPAKKPAKKK